MVDKLPRDSNLSYNDPLHMARGKKLPNVLFPESYNKSIYSIAYTCALQEI